MVQYGKCAAYALCRSIISEVADGRNLCEMIVFLLNSLEIPSFTSSFEDALYGVNLMGMLLKFLGRSVDIIEEKLEHMCR